MGGPNFKPFKGIRYNLKRDDLAIENLIAPPYDVISPEKQKELYARSPHNIVRLILGEEYLDDHEGSDRYARAARDFTEWLKEGVLRRDQEESIYLIAHQFNFAGRDLNRLGLVALRRLEEFGSKIHPHERTLAAPKVDRLKLTRATRASFSQIFGLYRDAELKLERLFAPIISERAPDISLTEDDQRRVELWAISDSELIARALGELEKRDIVIADGHHRYETALAYQKERSDGARASSADYVAFYLSNADAPGLALSPTHRATLDLTEFHSAERFSATIKEWFELEPIGSSIDSITDAQARMERLFTADELAPIGLIEPDGSISVLRARSKSRYLEKVAPIDEPEEVKTLDVSILQNLIFSEALGLTREMVAAKRGARFTVDARELYRMVTDGEARYGFLLNRLDIGQVFEVARSGAVMPQKSTYFYPKLLSGLVINPLD